MIYLLIFFLFAPNSFSAREISLTGYQEIVDSFHESQEGKDAFFFQEGYTALKIFKRLGKQYTYSSAFYFYKNKPSKSVVKFQNLCVSKGVLLFSISWEDQKKDFTAYCNALKISSDNFFVFYDSKELAFKARLRRTTGIGNIYVLMKPSMFLGSDFLAEKK